MWRSISGMNKTISRQSYFLKNVLNRYFLRDNFKVSFGFISILLLLFLNDKIIFDVLLFPRTKAKPLKRCSYD